MNDFIRGAIAMGFVVAAMLFLRFWHKSRDRLFLFFAASFGLMAVNRFALTISDLPTRSHETQAYLYLVRLLAFVLIIVAIVDKNLPRRALCR